MAVFMDLPTSLTVLNSCSQVDLLTESSSCTHWGSAVITSQSDIMLKPFNTHWIPTITTNHAQSVPSLYNYKDEQLINEAFKFHILLATCVNYAKINNSLLCMRGHISARFFRSDVLFLHNGFHHIVASNFF